MNQLLRFVAALVVATTFAACSKPSPNADSSAAVPKHEHHPPHGGAPVVLGQEAYHVEFVRDAASGRLNAYVLDGEMESFVRISQSTLEITATVDSVQKSLILSAVANSATGETVGNTSMFEGQADWLKSTPEFNAVLTQIEVRGTPFTAVAFNFPQGNDRK